MLGDRWAIEHVGSTSVPGLAAKPVIDLALRLPAGFSLDEAADVLLAAGWSRPIVVGDHWATFHPAAGPRSAIGHIFGAEQWAEAHVRLFAQWLREHPDDRRRYESLKRELIARDVQSSDYTDGKREFVHRIVDQARATRGLPPVDCPL